MTLKSVELYLFEDKLSTSLLTEFFSIRATSDYRDIMQTRIVADLAKGGFEFPREIERFPCMFITTEKETRYTHDPDKIRSFLDTLRKKQTQ